MPRIRTIKPSIWPSASFVGMSRDARLLAIGLISFADDEGRFPATISAISGYVFPYDDLSPARVKGWLREVVDSGMVRIYEVDGRPYGQVPKFLKHQRINRPQPSQLPAPPREGIQ